MKFTEQVAKVKNLLAAIFEEIPAAGETTAATELKDYTTDSGVILKIDKLEQGGKVFTQDGVTPVVAGFTLSDGTIVTVDEAGMITSVVVPVVVPVDAAVPDAAPSPAPVFDPATYDARFAALELALQNLQTSNAQKFSEATAKESKFGEVLNQILQVVEQIGAAPSDLPADISTGDQPAKVTKADRRDAFAKNLSARKTAV